MKPIDVSNQLPQLQPPPPSGESSMPAAGIVLNQQSGRSRCQVVAVDSRRSHIVTVWVRKNSELVVQA